MHSLYNAWFVDSVFCLVNPKWSSLATCFSSHQSLIKDCPVFSLISICKYEVSSGKLLHEKALVTLNHSRYCSFYHPYKVLSLFPSSLCSVYYLYPCVRHAMLLASQPIFSLDSLFSRILVSVLSLIWTHVTAATTDRFKWTVSRKCFVLTPRVFFISSQNPSAIRPSASILLACPRISVQVRQSQGKQVYDPPPSFSSPALAHDGMVDVQPCIVITWIFYVFNSVYSMCSGKTTNCIMFILVI